VLVLGGLAKQLSPYFTGGQPIYSTEEADYLLLEMTIEPFYVCTSETLARGEQTVPFINPSIALLSTFEIKDPFGLRKAIVPVLCRKPDGRIYGMGTAFHVDGWGGFLTADHVIEFCRHEGTRGNLDPSRVVELDPSQSAHPVLLLGSGLPFGEAKIPQWAFAPVVNFHTAVTPRDDPLALFRGESPHQVAADLSSVQAQFDHRAILPHSVPVRAQGWTPKIGEYVLAIGYPQLDFSEVPGRDLMKLKEGLHGAYGRVRNFFPKGRSMSDPTPVFEVEADWKSGMSGGPVFNQHGEVVGVVSRSLSPDGDLNGVGYAVSLGSIAYMRELMPSLDTLNPSWRLGYAVLGQDPRHLAGVFRSHADAHQFATASAGSYQIEFVSHRIGSDDFIISEDLAQGSSSVPISS